MTEPNDPNDKEKGMVRARFHRRQAMPRLRAMLLCVLACGVGCRGPRLPSLLPAADMVATVGPGEVVGLITDAHSGAPIDAAVVLFEPGALRTQTDARGRFRQTAMAEGRYRVRVLRIGYSPRTDSIVIGPGAGAVIALRLSQAMINLYHADAYK